VCEKDATGLCVALTLTQKLFLLLLFREEGCSLIYIRVTVIIIIIIIIIIMKVQSAKQPIVYKVPLNQKFDFYSRTQGKEILLPNWQKESW